MIIPATELAKFIANLSQHKTIPPPLPPLQPQQQQQQQQQQRIASSAITKLPQINYGDDEQQPSCSRYTYTYIDSFPSTVPNKFAIKPLGHVKD